MMIIEIKKIGYIKNCKLVYYKDCSLVLLKIKKTDFLYLS